MGLWTSSEPCWEPPTPSLARHALASRQAQTEETRGMGLQGLAWRGKALTEEMLVWFAIMSPLTR